MANASIKVDLANVMAQARGIIDEAMLPRLSQAVGAVAQQASIDWKESVARARLWSGEKVPYGNSITWKMTGPFSARVESDYKYAEEIDSGRPARDLKKMLDTSQKVRRTKDGRRFLVIPFRHNTPDNDAVGRSMPGAVYDLANAMQSSRVTGTGRRRSGEVMNLSPDSGMTPAKKQPKFLSNIASKKDQTVASRMYAWGDRLTSHALKEAGASHAQRRLYAGMVKMDTSSGKQKSSAYLTFRIMIEGSTGWVAPAKPGLYLLKGVTDRLQPLAEKAFAEAVKRDLS